MKNALVAAFILFSLANTDAASAAGLPSYQAGQAFIFDNGRVEQVREVDGDKVAWGARSGRSYVRSVNPVVPILEWSFRGQTGSRTIVGSPQRLWPLAAGKRVQFSTVNTTRDRKKSARRSVHMWTCTVRPMERTTVPAGTFAAFPIQCDRFSPNSMKVLERLTWHYSPEVEHYIRREARDMADGTSETYRLFAALPPREANPVRLEALALQAHGEDKQRTQGSRAGARAPVNGGRSR